MTNDIEQIALELEVTGEERRQKAEAVQAELLSTVAYRNANAWKLAMLLAEIKSQAYWRELGFASFEQFAELKCSIKRRKAQQLVQNHEVFVQKLGLSEETVASLPWTKANIVAGIMDDTNKEDLLVRILECSNRELQSFVQDLAYSNEPTSLEQPDERQVPGMLNCYWANTTSSWRRPKPPENEFYVRDDHWNQLCWAVARSRNALIVGPSGSGKTQLCRLLSDIYEKQCFVFNFGAMSEPRTSLIGSTHLDKKRGTFFRESRFVSALRTPGAIIILDEISRARPDAFNILLPALDGQRTLSLDESEDAAVVNIAAGVSFVGTANVGSEYTGTEELDQAIMDRFATHIVTSFPPQQFEVDILVERTAVESEMAEALVTFANEQRRMANGGGFATLISTRALLSAAEQIQQGISFREAVEFTMISRFSSDGGEVSERAQAMELLTKFTE